MRSKIGELNKRIKFITTAQARLANLPRDQYEGAVASEIAKYSSGVGGAPESKTIGGKTYEKHGGKWYER